MRSTTLGLLVLVVGMAFGWNASNRPIAASAPLPKPAPPGWEYKVIEQPTYPRDYEKTLNRLGGQGWEYCDTRVVGDWTGEVGRDVTILVFKRRTS